MVAVLLLLSLSLLIIPAAAQPCSARTSCGECTEDPDPGSRACFWCHAGGGSCKEVGDNITSIGTGGILGGCENLTFAPADCECQPAQRRSCGECTPDLNCVWASATLSVGWSTSLGGTPTWVEIGAGTACRAGTGFTGPDVAGEAVMWQGVGGIVYQVAWVLTPGSWYWSQCNLAGSGPAILYTIGGMLVVVCCCSVACMVVKRRRRRMRGGDIFVYREYSSVAQHGVAPANNVPLGRPIAAGGAP